MEGVLAFKYNPKARRPHLDEALRNRKLQLKEFPLNSVVEWKYSVGQMKVTGHDERNGRVETTKGSYNPDELTLIEDKKQ